MASNERQAAITSAVERLLARGGVSAVTMRAVAAEAGVSLRLVQYYGTSKDELLSTALDNFARTSVERWQKRMKQHSGLTSAVELVSDFLREALPTDPLSEEFHRLGVSLEALAITEPSVAGRAYQRHLQGLASNLSEALVLHEVEPSIAHRLALEVMGLAHGVGTLVMAKQISPLEAHELLDDYLTRLAPQLSPTPATHD